MAGKQIRAYFDFDAAANEKIQIKFAFSPVSTAGAIQISDLRSRIGISTCKSEGQAAWNKELFKIAVTTLDNGEMVNFYTALYHAFFSPTVYMDTDGQYKGIDQKVHKADVRPGDVAKSSARRQAAGSNVSSRFRLHQLHDLFPLGHLPCSAPFSEYHSAVAQPRYDPVDAGPLRSERS